jgi:DNA-binding protein YbaB
MSSAPPVSPFRPARQGPGRTVPTVDAAAWLDDYRRRLADIGHRARAAQAELAAVEATATSRDGAVSVTVNPAGALQRLVLADRAADLTRLQLAETVLTTARRAQAEAAELATRAMAPLIGEGSEAMRLLRAHLPAAARDGR